MENAQLYATANGLQKRDAMIVLSEFLPQLHWDQEEGDSVLDIGCGSGDVTKNLLLPMLPNCVREVTAVDLSQEMVSFASKHFDHNLITYRQLDIVASRNPRNTFPDGFTKVISLYCLHWIRDHRTCLRNIYALLQEGGQALLVFLAKNPLFEMYERMSVSSRWKQYMTDVSNFIPVYQYKTDPGLEFGSLAKEAGFQVDYCAAPELSYVFDNANRLKAAVEAVNPFVSRIPVNERNDFLCDCLKILRQLSPGDEHGRIVAKYNLLVATLTRISDLIEEDEEEY